MEGEADRRTRVLIIVEAVTLAHLARSTALADMLDAADWAITIAADPRFDFLFAGSRHARLPIDSISSADFDRALDSGRPIYDIATLERYVAADLRVIEQVRPDVVVGDFRLSLGVSARRAGIPYVNVTNAGWSPYAAPRFTVPDIPITRLLGVPAAQWLFDRLRPIIFAMHATPLNRVRRRHGLEPLPRDLRHAYTDADQVLYADLPAVVDAPHRPSNHRYLGPVLWAPDLPDPLWVADIPADKPIVYVNLGSSGRASSLETVLAALTDLPVTVIAATGGRGAVPPNDRARFCAPFLAGDRWTRRAALVISNGGSPTCYQALAASVPVIGVPGNLDQFVNMTAVQATGAGVLLRAGRHLGQCTRAVVATALDTNPCKAAATRLGALIAASNPALVLVTALRAALGREDAVG